MAVCQLCGNKFLRLKDDTKCGLCQLRLPGLSSTELQAINNKPQCVACGIASNLLENPICNGCIAHYKNEKFLPMDLLNVSGVVGLLQGSTRKDDQMNYKITEEVNFSSNATNILISAQDHQKTASDKRLSQRPSTARGAEGGINLLVHRNVMKATGIQKDKKEKREEAKLLGKGIRIAATLWKVDSSKNNKLVEVHPHRAVGVYEAGKISKTALNELLEKIIPDFRKCFPTAEDLTWGVITVYAHESQQKFSTLSDFDFRQTVLKFLQHFVDMKLGPSRNLENREIDLRFVFVDKNVFKDSDNDEDFDDLDSPKISRAQKRKGVGALESGRSMMPPPTQTSRLRAPMSAKVSALSTRAGASGRKESARPLASAGPKVRASFRPPVPVQQQWTRNPRMGKVSFNRIVASYSFEDGIEVKFNMEADIWETIEIALDYDKEGNEGLIGKGLSKMGVYARFNGREYVLTQHWDPITDGSHVEEVLRAEYALFCLGHAFKQEFDKDVFESGSAGVPKFYFNYKDAIFGKLEFENTGREGSYVPHSHFIATPLLPCGRVDPPVEKYTGNGSLGPAKDDITKAIHAFVHYSLVISENNLLFCDLQGTLDSMGVVCLIDPQAHTSANVPKGVLNVYWNQGGKAIDDFFEEHRSACKDNWICKRLKLRSSEEPTSTAGTSKSNKTRVSFLLRE